ncbi:MAG: DUF4870 domain-containing protein [Eubacteriales bacterium]|nr:DUF4870 domain-containing protein [Eubacteriales bacterium]
MADLNEKFNEFSNTKDTTSEFSPQDIQNNKVMAILAYLSWLVLIPLLGAKDSKFARYHCNQGLVLAIAELCAMVICGMLAAVPVIGFIFGIIRLLVSLLCVVLTVMGLINAANGQAKELPIIGSFKLLK